MIRRVSQWSRVSLIPLVEKRVSETAIDDGCGTRSVTELGWGMGRARIADHAHVL